jgi:GNAT superfamily N-acetyltransferase
VASGGGTCCRYSSFGLSHYRAPRSPVEIGPARDREEFLVPYGADLAPVVTAAHLSAKRMHHLVARVDGEPVGCARVRLMGDTAYVGAITVLPAWQGKGLGAALTIASGELAARYSDLVWLHCTPASRALYERLGYAHVDDHSSWSARGANHGLAQPGTFRRSGQTTGTGGGPRG